MDIVFEIFSGLLTFQILVFAIFNLFTLWASKRPSGFRKDKVHTFKIALVIPCYNEEKVIIQKLANSLDALSFIGNATIYVLDDGSTDNTFKLAEEYEVQHNLKNFFVWKNLAKNGKPTALNWIFGKLKEDIIVVTDADASLEKDSIIELISNFSDPCVGAVNGRIVLRGQSSLTQKEESMYRRIFDVWRRAESNLDSCAIFSGQLMAFRRELFEKFKIDDNTYSDDTDLAYKIRRLGYKAVYEPDAVVSEYLTMSVLARTKQEIRRARGLTRITLKNIGVLGRFGYFGKIIYPFSLFNYVLSPLMTLMLLLLLPFVVIEYPLLLALLFLLLIRPVRTAAFGYLYRQMALIIGLVTLDRGRWKPSRE